MACVCQGSDILAFLGFSKVLFASNALRKKTRHARALGSADPVRGRQSAEVQEIWGRTAQGTALIQARWQMPAHAMVACAHPPPPPPPPHPPTHPPTPHTHEMSAPQALRCPNS